MLGHSMWCWLAAATGTGRQECALEWTFAALEEFDLWFPLQNDMPGEC